MLNVYLTFLLVRVQKVTITQWIQLPHHRCQLPPTIQMFRINFYNEFVFPRRCARMFNQWIAVKSVTSLIKTNLHWKRQTIRQDHIYPFMAAFFNKRLRPPLESGNANAFRFFWLLQSEYPYFCRNFWAWSNEKSARKKTCKRIISEISTSTIIVIGICTLQETVNNSTPGRWGQRVATGSHNNFLHLIIHPIKYYNIENILSQLCHKAPVTRLSSQWGKWEYCKICNCDRKFIWLKIIKATSLMPTHALVPKNL